MPPAATSSGRAEREGARASTWMPLYIGDYLADTMHLSGPEHGAYLLLLMHAWRTGPLPDDDRQLANIARTDPAAWSAMAPTIRAFFIAAEGRLTQARLERERARALGMVEQRREAGKRSAAARAVKQQAANGRSTSVAAPLERNARPSPSPSPIPYPSDTGAEAPPADARDVLWAEGLPLLARLTGKPTGATRSLLGRLLRAAADDCAMVLAVLRDAQRDRPADPAAWITAAIATRTGRRAGTGPPSKLDWTDDPAPFPPAAFDIEGTAEELPL